jgi:hypothetical protein
LRPTKEVATVCAVVYIFEVVDSFSENLTSFHVFCCVGRQRVAIVLRALLSVTALAASLVYAQSTATASTITWNLSPNIPLSDGGTLNGTFTINSAGFLNGNSWDLVTAGGTLPSVTYTTFCNGPCLVNPSAWSDRRVSLLYGVGAVAAA